MGYVGLSDTSGFALLRSVKLAESRRLNEYGVKGMKWGIRKGEAGHGTSEKVALSILKQGLRAQEQDDGSKGVYLTNDSDEALDYATQDHDADTDKGNVAIVIFKNTAKLGLEDQEDAGLYHNGSIPVKNIARVEIYSRADANDWFSKKKAPRPISVLRPARKNRAQ